jgi:hypothetical protein
MKIKFSGMLILISLIYIPTAWSQCGNGVPSAGNPGCIPPNQSNSPYYQGGDSSVAPPAIWETRWGAIAQDQKTGRLGTSSKRRSESQSEKSALADCGSSNCKIIITYGNQCAVIVSGDNNSGIVKDPKLEIAKNKAMDICNNKSGSSCKTIYTDCSMPVRVQ